VIFAINIFTLISTLHPKFDIMEKIRGHPLFSSQRNTFQDKVGYVFNIPEECEIPRPARREPNMLAVPPHISQCWGKFHKSC
jgi:hypothetical protein